MKDVQVLINSIYQANIQLVLSDIDPNVHESVKKAYYEDLCIQYPTEHQSKKRKDDLFKLLESMAKVLGYKDSITWEDIQNPYLPTFMVNQEQNNATIQSAMATLLPQIISQQQVNANNQQPATNTK